jgi:hypothetical protein
VVQPVDDAPYTLPTIPHPDIVLQDPKIDQSLDIRVLHDLVELRMMEVFQQVDAKSFGSHALMLVTVEIPCCKSQLAFSQLAPFSYGFTNKYFKLTLGHMRFHGWSLGRLTVLTFLVGMIIWLHGYIGPLSMMI